MKQVEVTTSIGKTIIVSLEAAQAIKRAIEKGIQHAVINKENNHIIKVSTIVEMKEVWGKDPNQKVLNSGEPKDNRASINSDAYKEYQRKKQEILNNR